MDGGPLPFVPHFKYTGYQWHGTITGPDGKVVPFYKGTSDETFDQVTLNAIRPEDLQLNVPDAKAIIDEDTKK